MSEITLIRREYETETKCGMCGFRSRVLWNLGEKEREEYAACGDCTTTYIANESQYTIHKSE